MKNYSDKMKNRKLGEKMCYVVIVCLCWCNIEREVVKPGVNLLLFVEILLTFSLFVCCCHSLSLSLYNLLTHSISPYVKFVFDYSHFPIFWRRYRIIRLAHTHLMQQFFQQNSTSFLSFGSLVFNTLFLNLTLFPPKTRECKEQGSNVRVCVFE